MPGSNVVVIDDDEDEAMYHPRRRSTKVSRPNLRHRKQDVVIIDDDGDEDDCRITALFRKQKRVGAKRPRELVEKASSSRSMKARQQDAGNGGFIAEVQKVKESHEFKKADEEEWQRRQLELQKQAQEVQRLKKRKREQAERQLAVEARQKERVAEVRKKQLEEMKSHDLKDVIRGQVQAHLERKVAGCCDMRTLLCRLGIAVEGGVQCSPEQVNAAYKKALLRFHPDRTAANKDPRLQVEAEETFKLISRMKTSLRPLTTMKPSASRRN